MRAPKEEVHLINVNLYVKISLKSMSEFLHHQLNFHVNEVPEKKTQGLQITITV